jgi:hypothetical protein
MIGPRGKASIRLLRSAQTRLRPMSADLAMHSRDIALEGDRWFLSVVHGVDRNVSRAQTGLNGVASRWLARATSWCAPWLRRGSPGERIRAVLRREAKSVCTGQEREAFLEFSERIAVLVELVHAGAISARDVAFESADEQVPSEPEASMVEPQDGSTGLGAAPPQSDFSSLSATTSGEASSSRQSVSGDA